MVSYYHRDQLKEHHQNIIDLPSPVERPSTGPSENRKIALATVFVVNVLGSSLAEEVNPHHLIFFDLIFSLPLRCICLIGCIS
jgi:hypothetical protein